MNVAVSCLKRLVLERGTLVAVFSLTCVALSFILAAKGKGKGMVKEVLKGPEVCKDPVRLVSHAVGVNIFKQGEDPPLKSREEYPEWYVAITCNSNIHWISSRLCVVMSKMCIAF